jgi:protein-disulfide isomerase
MTRTRWIIFAVICVGILAALFLWPKPNRVDVTNVDPAKVETQGTNADHIYGNKNAKTTLIEYGDFQCPGCGAAYPTVKAIKVKYEDDLAFVFRNFPLTSLHPNALAAATAAEAAGKQNKFWQMHDKLYENQQMWETASIESRTTTFEGYAKEIGLNMEQYKKDLTSEEVSKKINRDRALANKIGASGTPTFVLNGKKLDGNAWQDPKKFEKMITDEINKAKKEQ